MNLEWCPHFDSIRWHDSDDDDGKYEDDDDVGDDDDDGDDGDDDVDDDIYLCYHEMHITGYRQ